MYTVRMSDVYTNVCILLMFLQFVFRLLWFLACVCSSGRVGSRGTEPVQLASGENCTGTRESM